MQSSRASWPDMHLALMRLPRWYDMLCLQLVQTCTDYLHYVSLLACSNYPDECSTALSMGNFKLTTSVCKASCCILLRSSSLRDDEASNDPWKDDKEISWFPWNKHSTLCSVSVLNGCAFPRMAPGFNLAPKVMIWMLLTCTDGGACSVASLLRMERCNQLAY